MDHLKMHLLRKRQACAASNASSPSFLGFGIAEGDANIINAVLIAALESAATIDQDTSKPPTRLTVHVVTGRPPLESLLAGDPVCRHPPPLQRNWPFCR